MKAQKCVHCGHVTMLTDRCIRCGFPASGEVSGVIGYTNPAISASIHLQARRKTRRVRRAELARQRGETLSKSESHDKFQGSLYMVAAILFGLYFIARAAGWL